MILYLSRMLLWVEYPYIRYADLTGNSLNHLGIQASKDVQIALTNKAAEIFILEYDTAIIYDVKNDFKKSTYTLHETLLAITFDQVKTAWG